MAEKLWAEKLGNWILHRRMFLPSIFLPLFSGAGVNEPSAAFDDFPPPLAGEQACTGEIALRVIYNEAHSGLLDVVP